MLFTVVQSSMFILYFKYFGVSSLALVRTLYFYIVHSLPDFPAVIFFILLYFTFESVIHLEFTFG